MGTRKQRERQADLWIATAEIAETPGHAFYERLNELFSEHRFDARLEHLCRRFYYRRQYGRPSMAPGVYFRLLLIGYFEGLDSERGIAWRVADSLSLRRFIGYGLDEKTPDHSTISRTRRLYWLSTHRAVFTWVLKMLAEEGLVVGQTVSVDATTLEANAAMRSIVRRANGQSYEAFVTALAEAEGIVGPSREQLARFDRKRKKTTSNRDWRHPHDPDSRVTKMKDGRPHLAHKAEHAVDLDTGALLAVRLPSADQGDTKNAGGHVLRGAEATADGLRGIGPGGGGGQRLPQRRGARGDGPVGHSHVHRRAGSRQAEVGGQGRAAEAAVRESKTSARDSQQTAPAQARGADGATLRTHVRDRRNAATASAWESEYPQTAPGPWRGVQSRAADANASRRGYPAAAEEADSSAYAPHLRALGVA